MIAVELYGGLKVAKIHASAPVVFVINHSGVQPAAQAKISVVHLPYFPYWFRKHPFFLKGKNIVGW